MQTMVPLYGFGGGSGGTGATLTVTAPAGATVTVSKDGKSKTKVADLDGVAVFKGLSSGDWLLSITDGTQTAQKTVTITADYTAAITFFSATIHVRYPAGSTCTATDGTTTLTAPDTSGTWDCVVLNAGTWTFGYNGHAIDSVEITENGETSLALPLYLYKSGEGPVFPMHSDGKTSVNISIGTDRIGITYTVARYAMSCVRNENAVDISKYNTLCARVNCTSNRLDPEYKGRLFVSEKALVAEDVSSGSLGLTLLTENSTATVYSVDVSTITDKMVYFGVHGAWMGDIYDIWLE